MHLKCLAGFSSSTGSLGETNRLLAWITQIQNHESKVVKTDGPNMEDQWIQHGAIFQGIFVCFLYDKLPM